MTTAVSRPPLARSSDRMIAGVCAGLANHLGWPVQMVRIGMVVAALAGGAGVAFYAWLWIMVPTADERAKRSARQPASPIAPAVSDRAGDGLSPGAAAAPPGAPAGSWRTRLPGMPYGKEILLGAGLLLAGGILTARLFGLDVPLGTLIPVAAILGGAAIAWMQLDETRRAGIVDKTKADQAGGWARLAAGLGLVVAGVLLMVSGSGSWEQTWLALLASVAVLGGVALVLLPWGLKFWRDLEAERAGRVRATERAEIAAHLHDSVLQTLALIQRRAGNEHDVVRLARAQERELRGWLYRDPGRETGQLSDALQAAAAEVEDSLGHAVDVVTVGDCALTERLEAMVQAAREAMLNAARHGGGAVSVYLEVTDDAAEVFVKDRGPGFDPGSIPADRLGVRESMIGRMRRHGGTATIASSPDGTEVRLRLPLAAAAPPNGTAATNGTAGTNGEDTQ
ncbi:PspC domain-containing protein [Arthrobacter sp. KBS0702]|uniref:ATP-binding protein n=1 Tax=Arthrobacter sp. KBS0702 TaxID=2578107 RepID=UPI00110E0789|nr:ATP-binding protein [Arthrobacter sp. KBS0702]QDW30588.1 PspC domain-containing protein [Arthrobacter sp. KBS0702]